MDKINLIEVQEQIERWSKKLLHFPVGASFVVECFALRLGCPVLALVLAGLLVVVAFVSLGPLAVFALDCVPGRRKI